MIILLQFLKFQKQFKLDSFVAVIHFIAWWMVSIKFIEENNNLYQWGDLFKKKIAEKNDYDMQRIIEDQFEKKEIIMISGKFKICGAIVKNKI